MSEAQARYTELSHRAITLSGVEGLVNWGDTEVSTSSTTNKINSQPKLNSPYPPSFSLNQI